MKLTGERFETLRKVFKANGNPFTIRGGWKDVFMLGPGLDWVVKVVRPVHFPNLKKLHLPVGSKDWAIRVKTILEHHMEFMNEYFPGLTPKTRFAVGEVRKDDGKKMWNTYKIQRAETSLPSFNDLNYGSTSEYLGDLFKKYPPLEENFRILYLGMKKIREYGLLLDIDIERNIKIITNRDGSLRLSIIDSMPVYEFDTEKYTRFYEQEWERGKDYTELVTSKVNPRQSLPSHTFFSSEHFYLWLQSRFDPED